MAPVSSLLALSSGTTALAGTGSSGSMPMRVRYVRKPGGCRDFCVSNSKMKIKTETPGFDVYTVIHSLHSDLQESYDILVKCQNFLY
jgi:hypothetical protein